MDMPTRSGTLVSASSSGNSPLNGIRSMIDLIGELDLAEELVVQRGDGGRRKER